MIFLAGLIKKIYKPNNEFYDDYIEEIYFNYFNEERYLKNKEMYLEFKNSNYKIND